MHPLLVVEEASVIAAQNAWVTLHDQCHHVNEWQNFQVSVLMFLGGNCFVRPVGKKLA